MEKRTGTDWGYWFDIVTNSLLVLVFLLGCSGIFFLILYHLAQLIR